jgi:hypothetical protein
MADSSTAEPSERAPSENRSRGRAIAAALCLIVAVVLTTPAAVAYWGQRTLNDGQRYLATVGPLVDSPEVQQVIATTVTDAIEKQVDVEALLKNVFADVITQQPRLEALVGPLSGAINGLIERVVNDFIASDAFRDLWIAANTRAQQALVALLNGDESGAISLQDGQVVLDLSDVIDQVKTRLVAQGLTFIENAPIPTVDKQVVILDAPQADQLRTIYAFTNPVAKWLLVVVAALYLAAFVLARRRPRMAVIIGVGLALNALLVAFALSVGRQLFVDELAGTVFGPASKVFFNTLLAYLERGWHVFLWLGAILAAAGWFSGSNRSGTVVRSTVSGGLENIGSNLAEDRVRNVGRWVDSNAGWLRIVSVAVGVVVLLWGNDISPTRLGWSTALVVLLLLIVQILVGAGRSVGTKGAAPPVEATT